MRRSTFKICKITEKAAWERGNIHDNQMEKVHLNVKERVFIYARNIIISVVSGFVITTDKCGIRENSIWWQWLLVRR